MSANLSHRVSLAGPSSLSRPQNLVSERLNRSHDNFLSHLGSFIGRLHLQAQSRPELALAIRQSATSGGELLVVVDVVRTHSTLSSESLNLAREAMYERIRDLVFGGREILRPHGPDEDDVLVPQDNGRLLDAATGCVKAAGECVAKTKWVIERIGDFELDNGVCAEMAIDFGLDILPEEPAAPVTEEPQPPQEDNVSVSKSTESKRLSLRPLAITIDKPLPEVPLITTPIEASPEGKEQQHYSPASSRPQSYTEDVPDSMASSVSSIRPTAPQLPPLSTSLTSQDDYSPLEPPSASNDGEFHSTFRGESMTASSTGSNSTYLSRDSESSLVSQTSTRATTPDHTLMPKPSISELSVAASSTIADEVEDVESKLLAKTYAHELMINKEGQVSGGSLPALVERLTTHESTPDAMFVSTFYLTFRLFCTPEKLAEALIDRFDYVADSPHMTSPVRLRVYNVFKGWLESHWRHDVDKGALKLITPFAESKLGPVLPAAGKRLLELTQRVSSHDGSLVPRLVSSMGKTNTSIATYIPADTPLPSPALTKSQANALASWRNGSGAPTILDFEPLEIARQLTLKQMAIFCSIMPEELLASSWMKKGGVDSPNVKAMVTLSNDLTNLVADTILHHNEVKKRAAVIKQWIKVAHQCLELNNYDALMAIIASLNSSIISRLRRTWDVVSPKRREMLRSLQAIVEPSNNNKVLRNRLQNHVPPCLPFLGMFLTDLTFVDIGNPATKQLPSSPNGINTPIQYRDGHHNGPHDSDTSSSSCLTVVNFDKHMRTARIIGDLQRFQIPYRLMEVPDLRDWLDAQFVRVRELDQASVQVTYYRKSLLLEPREVAAAVAASSASAASPSSGLSALGVGNSSSATLLPLRPTTSNGESGGSRLTGWMSKDRQGSVTSAI